MDGMSDIRNEIEQRLGVFARQGAKATFAGDWHGKRVTSNAGKMFLVQRSATGYDLYSVDSGKKAKSMTQEQMDEAQRAGKFRDVFSRPGAKAKFAENVTYSVTVHIGDQPAGERSTKSLDEAKAYAKAMLQTAKANAKGNPVVVDVYPVVNYEPKPAVLTLRASRPGAKAAFGSKRTTAGALRKQLKAQGMTDAADLEWHGISASDPDSTPYWLHEDGSMEKIKSSRKGGKATMGKYWVEDGQSNAKQPVKSMREGIQLVSGMQNGVLRYADHGMTSILAYGRGSGGASLTEDGKLHQKHASARDGAKATFAFPGIVVKEDAQYIYYYPDEDDRATFADEDGKGAYTVKSNRTGKPVSAKTYRSWDEAVSASNAINEKLPPLKKRKGFARTGAKAAFGADQIPFWLDALASQVVDQKDVAKKNAQSIADYVFKHGTEAQIKRFVQLADRVGLRVNMSRPGAKATAAKADDKTECADCETEQDKAGLKLMEKADKAVSDKIRTLIKEGKPQDQAVAIALDMKRRGEL